MRDENEISLAALIFCTEGRKEGLKSGAERTELEESWRDGEGPWVGELGWPLGALGLMIEPLIEPGLSDFYSVIWGNLPCTRLRIF